MYRSSQGTVDVATFLKTTRFEEAAPVIALATEVLLGHCVETAKLEGLGNFEDDGLSLRFERLELPSGKGMIDCQNSIRINVTSNLV